MKKFLIILFIFIGIVLAALITVPVLFKDALWKAIDKEMAKNIRAEVFYDRDKVSVSFFKKFPDITLTLNDFGIVGINEFEDDTLASLKEFDLTVNFLSLITGDQVKLSSVNLISPRIMILVNENGLANYDILIDSEDASGQEEKNEASNLSVLINEWTIREGSLIYYDFSNDFLIALDGINHIGSGDFTMDVFDIKSNTRVEKMMASFENIEYLRDKKLEANIVLTANLPDQIYTFRENEISINDFSFGFDGSVSFPEDATNLDLSFYGNDNSVKSLLSLIPGAYKKDYAHIEAQGSVDFKGFIEGNYMEDPETYPAFSIQMLASNGMIKYPDLPKSISNIQFGLNIENNTGVYERTIIDLKQLRMNLGENAIEASVRIKNLVDYDMDARIVADLNLAEVMNYYPVDSTEMAGNLKINLEAHGIYDTVKHTLPLKGNLMINDLFYRSNILTQGLNIRSSMISATSDHIEVQEFNGAVGRSDVTFKGNLTNYLDYFLYDDAVLKGRLDFLSKRVDLNEWLTEDDSGEPESNDTTGVIRIPRTLDIVLNSNIEKVHYDNLILENFIGMLIIRDGAIIFDEVAFSTLGGLFSLAGIYDSDNDELPGFDFNLSIQKLSIPESYRHFMTIQKLAPIAEIMQGNFSSDIKLAGKLSPDLTPVFSTLTGKGIVKIADAAIKGAQSKILSGITQVSKLTNESTNVTLSDVILNTQIENGKVFTQPFNIRFGENKALIAGSSGLDGSIDYNVKLDVPPQLIQSAGSLFSSVTGKEINPGAKDIKLNLKVAGFYNDPNISILGVEQGESRQAAEQALKEAVEEEKEKAIVEAEKILEEEKEKAPEEVQKILEDHEEEIEKAKDKLKNFFKKGGN